MDYIDYVILDNYIIINNVEYGNFVYIIDIVDNVANVNVSNTEMYFNVYVSGCGADISIKEFFSKPIEV